MEEPLSQSGSVGCRDVSLMSLIAAEPIIYCRCIGHEARRRLSLCTVILVHVLASFCVETVDVVYCCRSVLTYFAINNESATLRAGMA